MRGWGVDSAMADELVRRGGTADGFAAQQITAPLARSCDLILCATREHRAFIAEQWPDVIDRTFVMKPYAHAIAATERMPPWEPAPPAAMQTDLTRDDDIADPYRLGSPEAARAADEIDEVLKMIIRPRG